MNQLINEVNAFINSSNGNTKPRKFRVVKTEFDTYDEVVKWAWNEFKICEFDEIATTIEAQHDACNDLTNHILMDEELFEEYKLFLQYGPRKYIKVEEA